MLIVTPTHELKIDRALWGYYVQDVKTKLFLLRNGQFHHQCILDGVSHGWYNTELEAEQTIKAFEHVHIL